MDEYLGAPRGSTIQGVTHRECREGLQCTVQGDTPRGSHVRPIRRRMVGRINGKSGGGRRDG